MKTMKLLLLILIASIFVTIEGASLEDRSKKQNKNKKKIKKMKGKNLRKVKYAHNINTIKMEVL